MSLNIEPKMKHLTSTEYVTAVIIFVDEVVLLTSKAEMFKSTQSAPSEEGKDSNPYFGASIYDSPSKPCTNSCTIR